MLMNTTLLVIILNYINLPIGITSTVSPSVSVAYGLSPPVILEGAVSREWGLRTRDSVQSLGQATGRLKALLIGIATFMAPGTPSKAEENYRYTQGAIAVWLRSVPKVHVLKARSQYSGL